MEGAVAVKAVQFRETAVESWFAIMEAQFSLAKVTESATKFYHVLSALPPQTVMKLPKIVRENANYETLKKAVIEHFKSSKPELFDNFMNPSTFLGEMRATANKLGVNDDLVRHRFQNLPTAIAPIVASQMDGAVNG